MRNKKKRRQRKIRLSPEYALLMFQKYFERLKESKKKYSRKRKQRKSSIESE